MEKTFKERVKETLIDCSKDYKENFINKKYIIYSKEFKYNKFYTITAKEDNFLHLTGLKTNLTSQEFFDRCINKTIKETDFEIKSKRQKGSVRRKINVLKSAMNIFKMNKTLWVEENFVKNKIICTFASTDNICTLGFILKTNSKPNTLLKGNELKNPIEIDLLIQENILDKTRIELINNLKLNSNEIENIITQKSINSI